MISTRYAKANNKYMKEYVKNLPSIFIPYLDANNLYGWAMSQKLPFRGFEWMSETQLSNWKKHPCILEVDLEYPQKLHGQHNDYPLAPESMKVNKVEKLVPNLSNKTKYVVHHETLKFYQSQGLKIIKILRVVTFEETEWIKPYIMLNTKLRAQATKDFEKEFFKLMNNSVFGKTMENIRNRVEVHLVTSEEEARKLILKPNYNHRKIFSDNLIAIHMKKTHLIFNKPIYVGMSILDLAKLHMYDFHYNYIKPKYGEKAKLLFTDTDSLMYAIQTDDFYKDIAPDVLEKFDTSNFPKDHPSGIANATNKKVIGMFKNETGGQQISEFVGLRAKLYAYLMAEGVESKKCKGIKKPVVKKSISYNDCKNSLFNKEPQMRKMNVIRSYKHEMYTETVNKVALSHEEDKRNILEDGIHTLAHGHYLSANT